MKQKTKPKLDFLTEDYQGRKILYFKDKYEQRIEIYKGKVTWWNCTCKFSSAYRFSDKFKDTKCKHIKKCLKTIKKNTTLLES